MSVLILLLLLAALGFAGYRAYLAHAEEQKEARTVKSLPPSVQHVVAQMDAGSQAVFFNEYEAKKKKKSLTWVLWFVGWHYLYLRQTATQLAFWFTGWGCGAWWIVDFFRVPTLVRTANEQVAREALQTLNIGATFANLPSTASGLTQPIAPAAGLPAGTPPPPPAPAGWHADPTGRHGHRYHDGSDWTDQVSNDGVASTDPT